MKNLPEARFTLPVERFIPYTSPGPKTTACDVCDQWEAVVRFHDTKLCDKCAAEERIEIL